MRLELKKPNISLEFLDRISPFKPKYPYVAAELNTRSLIMVKMRKEKEQWHLSNYSIKELSGPAIGQSIFRPEITSREILINAFKELTLKMGLKPSNLSLAIPDNIIRVSLLNLPDIPRSRKQLMEVIKWKIRKSIPFRIDDAMISYQVLENGDGRGEKVVLVSLMRSDTIRQYEDIFESSDFRVGLVDCNTFNIYNLYRSQMSGSGDVGFINGSYNYFTFMILRKGKLIFFRCKNFQAGKELSEEEVGRFLSRELNTSLSYYVEKLGGKGFQRTYYRTVGHDADNFRATIENVGLSPCEAIDLSKVIRFDDFSDCDEIKRNQLAPAIGTVVGRRL